MELLHLSEQSDRPLTFDQNVKENLFKVNFKVFSLAFNISAESTGKQLYCNSEGEFNIICHAVNTSIY